MIYQIAYQIIFGLPLVAWGGVLTLASLIMTATLGYLYHAGRANFRFRWHWIMAIITVVLAIIHGTVALLALLGF